MWSNMLKEKTMVTIRDCTGKEDIVNVASAIPVQCQPWTNKKWIEALPHTPKSDNATITKMGLSHISKLLIHRGLTLDYTGIVSRQMS
jgi:phage terminase large subunit